MSDSSFNLIRNADVKVAQIMTRGHKGVMTSEAEVTINGDIKHRFPVNSRVSKHLEVMSADDLSQRLTGGSFFFIDDTLVDFRDGQYGSNGFIHTDESIGVFMDLLGYQERSNMPLHHSRRRKANADQGSIVLRKVWNENEIIVPGYQAGGDFRSELSFVWNPYVKTINSQFDLIRLICTNGMVGLTSFLNTKVPLMNRWEEHLDIAARQIQNKVSSIVVERVGSMSSERASVGDCLLLEQHAFDRLYAPGEKGEGERTRLLQLMAAVAPKAHLAEVYKDNVFSDKNLASQLPAHLTNFDAFNIATELRTHTSQSMKSSDNALDKFANGILFDREDNFSAAAGRGGPALASFADAERAFYGDMN